MKFDSNFFTRLTLAIGFVMLLTVGLTNNNIVEALQEPAICSKDTDLRPTSLEYLSHFNCGDTTKEEGVRHFTLIAEENQTVPISNLGHEFNGWTFNDTIPGPTMRMVEGDHVKVTVINSGNSTLPHSLHMHSIHKGDVDGVTGSSGNIMPGKDYTYEFVAQPAGVYPYHCHVEPIADHINRGLYGVMIIDPKEEREPMGEMVMMMNGYDMHYDQEGPVGIVDVNKTHPAFPPSEAEEESERDNEIYTVNGKAFDYMGPNMIQLKQGEPYRIYLVNMLEFDLINTMHIHGMMFKYIPSGTEDSYTYVNDIVTLSQGDRGIIEVTPKEKGEFMFHAHQAEFSSLGWMAFFNVT